MTFRTTSTNALVIAFIFVALATLAANKDAYAADVDKVRDSAESGDANGQDTLGNMYIQGSGVARDPSEAVKWWRKAAEQGKADAQYNVGIAYFSGEGAPKDPTEAVKWWRKAAEQGLAEAQNRLGWAYGIGFGIAEDQTKAAAWHRKAAEQGNMVAEYNLGSSYSEGRGLPKNPTEAVKWWNKAAEQGYAHAQYDLGIIYFRENNYVLADMWLDLASEQNDKAAIEALGDVEKTMTMDQLSQAKTLKQEWKAKHPPKTP